MNCVPMLALLAAGACAGARAALPDVVFSIGQEDHSPAEFALARGAGWQRYAETFKAPVRFEVGRSRPAADWPYIHPNTADHWAGGRTHTFTIAFDLPEAPTSALTLAVGQVNALQSPTLRLDANGATVARLPAPSGSGDASGLAEGRTRPARPGGMTTTTSPESPNGAGRARHERGA